MHRDPLHQRPRQHPLHVAIGLIVLCLVLSPWGIAVGKLAHAFWMVAIDLFEHYYPRA
jgi:hypothetical protein